MPLDHASIAVPEDQFQAIVAWYEKALAPLGYKKTHDFGVAVGFGDFWVASRKATSVNEYTVHIAFRGKDREAVDKFYEAAIAAGGVDNGKPGLRAMYHPTYYGAFVHDPIGNNIEAVCHEEVK